MGFVPLSFFIFRWLLAKASKMISRLFLESLFSRNAAPQFSFAECGCGTRAAPSAIPSLRSALTAFGGYPVGATVLACGKRAICAALRPLF